jgi:hypothetical protein
MQAEADLHHRSLARRRLREFGSLPIGWHFGEGTPIAITEIHSAERFIRLAEQLALRCDVFPGVDGECMVALYQKDVCVRVIVSPGRQDSFGLRVEHGKGENVRDALEPSDNATLDDVCIQALKLAGNGEPDSPLHVWHLSGPSTSGTMMYRSSGSQNSSSRILHVPAHRAPQ